MRKAKVKKDGSREYRPSRLARLLIWFFATFFLILAGYYATQNEVWYSILCGAPLFGVAAWFGVIRATQMSLTVRDDGLEYRFGSGRVISRWDNLQKFGHRSSGRSMTTGIDLRGSVKQQVTGGRFDKMLFGEESVNFIPLDVVKVPFHYHPQTKQWQVDTAAFAKTPFGQELLHYAPHLFEQE